MTSVHQVSRISVCMATYNGDKFIGRQLQSILSQLSETDEVVISDDGSTDNTRNVIDSLADNRIKFFINQGRKGPVGNFENALCQASGELIFLADQDDVWLSDKVSVTRSLLANCDLVLADCEVIDSTGKVIQPSFFQFRKSGRGFWRNLLKNSYMGCCMAFRREVLDYVLPIPQQVHMHDWWIGLLLEAKGSVLLYNKPLIRYVRHGSNASPTGETGYGFSKQLLNRILLLANVAKRLLA
ncbi:alpha-L-Rha alpha-1,3-L-rhamnosyltransferase [Nostoc linckia z16]|nr:alpha-L-Rha alpha-1,3-L-rhamnosyltransferase [Nostoc linckia z16]